MPNLQCIQGSTTVNGTGAVSTEQPGLVTGQQVASNVQGVTPGSYTWSLAVPKTSTTCALSSTTAAVPTWTPDVAGDYLLTLNGTYTLPLSITAVNQNDYRNGAVVPANQTPAQTPTPAQGVAMSSDSTTAGSVLTTDANGNKAPVAIVRSGTTAQRPTSPAVGLYAGFIYYDTTLNKPIWRNAANNVWVDATGATV